ncbi:MAG: hypothetical protein ACYC0V_20680 [Armatimonadota bacterium]
MKNKTLNEITELVNNNKIYDAIAVLEGMIDSNKCEHFSGIADMKFTNSHDDVVNYVNEFINECQEEFDVKAIYLEMNGFDINYETWFFSGFGFDVYESDQDDLDWLSDWQMEDDKGLILTGLESIQKDFAWYDTIRDKNDHSHDSIYEIAALLITIKFIALVHDSLESASLIKPIPVLATAHDFDIIGRFLPSDET